MLPLAIQTVCCHTLRAVVGLTIQNPGVPTTSAVPITHHQLSVTMMCCHDANPVPLISGRIDVVAPFDGAMRVGR